MSLGQPPLEQSANRLGFRFAMMVATDPRAMDRYVDRYLRTQARAEAAQSRAAKVAPRTPRPPA